MHARRTGRRRDPLGTRSTTRRHAARHADTMAGRFHLDWIWRGVWAWALAFAAATHYKTRRTRTIFRATVVLRTVRFMDAIAAAPGKAPVRIVPAHWNSPTRTSIEATPWGGV